MRWSLLLLVWLIARPAPGAVLADETMRYVNDQVISFGDILLRNQLRLADYERRGKPRPADLAERIHFSRESLEELTDEELLVQYGKAWAAEHKFQLVDHERVNQMVAERARATGRGMTLREQAEQRRWIERQQIIESVLEYFESRSAHVTPEDMQRSFQSRPQDFSRPPRAKVLEIIYRPSSPAERQEVRQARFAVFKRAQDVPDPAVKKAVESRLDAYLAANPDEQERLLAEAMQELATMESRSDLDLSSLQVVRDAKQTVVRGSALRDADQALAQLSALRESLVGKDADAFRKAAMQSSQGPNASQGGDLGWIEPGSEGKTFDAPVFALKAGELSPAFRTEQVARLVFVTDKIEARSREFSEVQAEVESGLKRERHDETRQRALTMLRAKASIKDVVTIDHLTD